MQEIFDKANAILEEINSSAPVNAEAVEQFRIQFLGTKSVLKDLFGAMAQLPVERKRIRSADEYFESCCRNKV